MSESLLRWLPLICLMSAGAMTFWRMIWLRRHAGVDAIQFATDDSLHVFLGWAFKAEVLVTSLYVLTRAIRPDVDHLLGLGDQTAGWFGIALGFLLMVAGLLTMMMGQYVMGTSWRIGVDSTRKTSLVASGLFRYSRNPIFTGVAGYLIGLFLIAPTGPSLALLVCGLFAMNVQVRLEEEHLRLSHGVAYDDYTQQVRRWL